jgi:nitrate/nitrite transport system ATP-binding protein
MAHSPIHADAAPPAYRTAGAEAPFLTVRDVSMRFGRKGRGFLALDAISLDVRRGEFVSLIGHSGCGKSTLLNLVAGLLLPTRGWLACGDQAIVGPGPDRAVVFQNHSLLPWMTCFENVRLGVQQVFGRSLNRQEVRDKTEAALRLVHLEDALHKYPFEISGGMKQRVGIARALAIEPRVLLLDEPFGALDALTRASLQDELIRIVEATHSTVVMVTHDVDEAILLSDRVILMTNGPGARIGDIVDIGIDRPRDRLALAADPASIACRQRLIEFLYLKHRRSP